MVSLVFLLHSSKDADMKTMTRFWSHWANCRPKLCVHYLKIYGPDTLYGVAISRSCLTSVQKFQDVVVINACLTTLS